MIKKNTGFKLAVISLKGESSNKIVEEAKKYFDEVDHLNIKKIEVNAEKELNVLYEGQQIKKYDCVYIRGSFRYSLLQRSISGALQGKCYMPIEPKAFTLAHNKFLTLLELQKKKVLIPKSSLAATDEEAKKTLKTLKFPIIIKTPTGSQGKGVMFAESESSAKSMIDALGTFKQPYILQEYIETDATDIRAIVLGDKVVASMKRKGASEDARSNISIGGKGIPYELDFDTEQTALRAAKAIGAEVCAIDILESGKSYVLEVNLSPGLKISKIINKNIADILAKFLYEKTKQFKTTKDSLHYNRTMEDIEKISQDKNTKGIITTPNIKLGIIKLPRIATTLSGFNIDDEIVIKAKKGKITIEKYKL